MNDTKEKKDRFIVVNGSNIPYNDKEISFDQLVIYAYDEISDKPYIIYTITYKRGTGNKPEGSMIKGDDVKVKDGMRFNVTKTDKSQSGFKAIMG